jgi:hypothetical protein
MFIKAHNKIIYRDEQELCTAQNKFNLVWRELTAAGDLPVLVGKAQSYQVEKPQALASQSQSEQWDGREKDRHALKVWLLNPLTKNTKKQNIVQGPFYGVIKNQNLASLSFEYFMTRDHI